MLMVINIKMFPSNIWSQTEPGEVKHELVMQNPVKEVKVNGIKVIFWVNTILEYHQMMEKDRCFYGRYEDEC